jgi:DNA-directed RNA polymerase specialized sigma24 family protein
MDGFTYQEVADMLGIGLSATKMRVVRGREAFREVWSQDEASAA